jgi:parvulin-like peptidyl-prolyl isomerase
MTITPTTRLCALLAAALCIVAPAASAAPAKANPPAPAASAAQANAIFARVGTTTIALADYQRALSVAMRNKYYHAKPPEGEIARFQREVGEDVVNRVLLLAEARRRGLKTDAAKTAATIAGYEAQYKASANWQANRDKMLAAVVPQLERESLLEQLLRQVRDVAEPSEAVARTYHEQHPDLFIEPEQLKLSLILLRVDPSSPVAQWRSADDEGRQLHAKLVAGASFAELARLHSGDKSAPRGGQLETMHRGQLPEAVHKVIDPLAVGALSEPVRLLEGVAILRVDERKPSQQRGFEEVRTRAADLWQRAEGDARWQALLAGLRRATPVRIDESHYAPLRATSDKPGAS